MSSDAMRAMLEGFTKMAEEALLKELPKIDGCDVRAAMSYSALAGGKRLRPAILLASCVATGGEAKNALAFSAAIEMVHTYSLIHDDLPAMDNDDYRRGRLSCHKKFDEATAILAGDALLNRAFEVMLRAAADFSRGVKGEHGLADVAKKLRAAEIIAKAAGINGMVYGQACDIKNEGLTVNEETLNLINENKTGALISAAFEAGAVLGGANDCCVDLFARAGRIIGKAFQIQDDLLDCVGQAEMLGKPVDSDKKNNKKTYASIWGADKCAAEIRELTREAVCLLEKSGADIGFLVWVANELAERKK